MSGPYVKHSAPATSAGTISEMRTSLCDAEFFNEKIQKIARGREPGQRVDDIRRYFRAYLHCWKTVLYLVRESKGLKKKADWIRWCNAWKQAHLDQTAGTVMDQLRETRDFDTHTGSVVLSGEVAAGLFPLVFLEPVPRRHGGVSHARRELVGITKEGLAVLDLLIRTQARFAAP